jgi:hypothetical protein
MKILFTSLFCCLISTFVFSQSNWRLNWSIATDSVYTWDVDPAKNTYLIQGSHIQKYNAQAIKQQEQSIKAIGTIQKIDAKNVLKIAVFSEDQQRICFLDNALAPQGPCIELIDQGIQLAQTFVYSNQIDRVWVFDEINAELKLITTQNSQAQLIQNIRDLVNIQQIQSLFELNNELFLIDTAGTVVRLDNFGSLISSIQLPFSTTKGIQISDNGYLITGENNQIYFISFDGDEKQLFFDGVLLNPSVIQSFKLVGKTLFIGTSNGLYCFDFVQ